MDRSNQGEGRVSFTIDGIGTFDVNNFGDLLYPHLLRDRLPEGSRATMRSVAPTSGRPSGFRDACSCVELGTSLQPDLAVVGGGNLLGANPTGVYGERTSAAYESLITASGRSGTIWNGLGVMNADRPMSEATTASLRRGLSYCAVRDEHAASYLHKQVSGLQVEVIPDLAFGIAAMWMKPPRTHFAEEAQRVIAAGGPYATVSIKERDVDDRLEATLSLLRIVRARQIRTVVFMPLGLVHGDGFVARALATSVRDIDRTVRPIVVIPTSLRSTCDILAGAAFHIGTSLHGGVVSVAHDVPTLWVSRIDLRKNFKIDGALQWTGKAAACSKSWADAPIVSDEIASDSAAAATRLVSLSRHWATVRQIVYNLSGAFTTGY